MTSEHDDAPTSPPVPSSPQSAASERGLGPQYVRLAFPRNTPDDTAADSMADSPMQDATDHEERPVAMKPLPAARRASIKYRVARTSGRGSRKSGTPRKGDGLAHTWIQEAPEPSVDEESASVASLPLDSDVPHRASSAHGTAIGTRRNANGTVGSVYSGQKIRHIKKEDGTPLWRKDIQHRFLELVVNDETHCFTRVSDGAKNMTFVDIYIDAMARSSKTSKILKDRLHSDRQAAKNMAMICLLVNVGRMNTTLNFFPEMRAQLRTYHSIPSLQAYKSQRDYKSLQDAPRLKSILKGASEDNPNEPKSLSALRERKIPRTNPVNLIFVLSHYMPKVSELHFPESVDFFDLVIKHTVSSASRAKAFLWLMWWYLESDFTREDALNNPFGPGEYGDTSSLTSSEDSPVKVPDLVFLGEEEGNAENVDPEFEQEFAEKMTGERKRILLEDVNDPGSRISGRWKKGLGLEEETFTSDAESIEPPFYGVLRPPKRTLVGTGGGRSGRRSSLDASLPPEDRMSAPVESGTVPLERADSIDEERSAYVLPEASSRTGGTARGSRGGRGGRGGRKQVTSSSGRILTKSARAQALDRGTPDTMGTPQPAALIMSQYGRGREDSTAKHAAAANGADNRNDGRRRPRPLTQHQRALEHHRRERVEYALAMKRKRMFDGYKANRENGNWIIRAARRIDDMEAVYDSEEEEGGSSWGLGGVVSKPKSVKKRKTDNDEALEDDSEKENEAGQGEGDDYGEEAEAWLKVFNRTKRRLDKWGGDRDARAYEERNLPPEERLVFDYGSRGRRFGVGMDDAPADVLPSDIEVEEEPSLAKPWRRTVNRRGGQSNTVRGGRRGSRRQPGPARKGYVAKAKSLGQPGERVRRTSNPGISTSKDQDEDPDREGEDLNDEISRRLLAEHDTESERSDNDEGVGMDGDEADEDGDVDMADADDNEDDDREDEGEDMSEGDDRGMEEDDGEQSEMVEVD